MCQIFGGSRFFNFVPNSTIELYSFDKEEQCCLKYRNFEFICVSNVPEAGWSTN